MHLYRFDFHKINFIDTTIFNMTNQHKDDLFIIITFSNLITYALENWIFILNFFFFLKKKGKILFF